MPSWNVLQNLTARYPKGNIWYVDEEGYFSSIEQVRDFHGEEYKNLMEKGSLKSEVDISKQRAEADLLSKVFEKARQIIFVPLWDAGGSMLASLSFQLHELTEYRSMVFWMLSLESIGRACLHSGS